MKGIKIFFESNIGLIVQECIILALIFAVNFIIKFIIRRIECSVNKKQQNDLFHQYFVRDISRPIRILIWVLGIAYMLHRLFIALYGEQNLSNFFDQFRDVVLVVAVGWFIFELKKQFKYAVIKKSKSKKRSLDYTKIDLFSKLGTITIIILTGLILLETLGVDIAALIAFGGVGGIAVGFAAKDIISNFFGGMMIHISRPFAVGDWIYTIDRKIEGTVLEIGYYMTKIRSFERRPIYVPNALFSSSTIVNASRMSKRRIKHSIGVRYNDFAAIAPITETIYKMLREHKRIDQEDTMLVNFHSYGESSLDILVYTYANTIVWKEWLEVQQDVLLKIGEIIRDHGADIAFPTRTLDLPNQDIMMEGFKK